MEKEYTLLALKEFEGKKYVFVLSYSLSIFFFCMLYFRI